MKLISIPRLALGVLIAFLTNVPAAPLPVTVTHELHTVSVARGSSGPGGLDVESRTNELSVPVSDSLISGGSWVNAAAESILLRISAFAAIDFPNYDSASASARTEFHFIPDSNGSAPITLDFSGGDHWYISNGSVSLFDLTDSSSLWSYDWSGFAGTVPWVYSDVNSATAMLSLPTGLIDSHEYRFIMFTQVFSQEPSEPEIVIELSGLQVPEPSSSCLLGLAAIGFAIRRRWV